MHNQRLLSGLLSNKIGILVEDLENELKPLFQ